MTDSQSQKLNINNERERMNCRMLYKQHSNTGTPLIFVSGLFAGDWMWESTIAHLNKKKKYTIIQMIPPLAALGGTIEVLRERLLDIITAKPQAVVVGNSLGGLLALDIAARWPEHVLALVVSGAPGMGSVNLGIGLPKKGDKEWFLRLASKLFVNQRQLQHKTVAPQNSVPCASGMGPARQGYSFRTMDATSPPLFECTAQHC